MAAGIARVGLDPTIQTANGSSRITTEIIAFDRPPAVRAVRRLNFLPQMPIAEWAEQCPN